MIPTDMLPDDVLLAIFEFCVVEDQSTKTLWHSVTKKEIEAWHSLTHVCRQWRSVVFGSPHRLKLRLVCTTGTPARDRLDVWPAFPLFVWCYNNHQTGTVDNIIAALERSDRVCQIHFSRKVPSSLLEKVFGSMQKPFPELTRLELTSYDEMAPVLPDSFLGGSARRLQSLWLNGIPFPGLRNFLLSATHLTELHLLRIRHSEYLSPQAILTVLSALTGLETFRLEFQSPRSRPDWASRLLPPPTRSVLPVLTSLIFEGVSEYLEDFVARIDAPRLNELKVILFNQIVFDTPQFIQFIGRTPMSKALETAHIAFDKCDRSARVLLSSKKYGIGSLSVDVSCRMFDWLVSSVEQVCTSCLPPLSTLEDLYMYETQYGPDRQESQDNLENALWMELLSPFAAVENLYLSRKFAPHIAPALQELVGSRTMEVLPNLQNIFLEGLQPSGPIEEAIGRFVASRQIASHPVVVSRWVLSLLDNLRMQDIT